MNSASPILSTFASQKDRGVQSPIANIEAVLKSADLRIVSWLEIVDVFQYN
jgi:hypothetical protein